MEVPTSLLEAVWMYRDPEFARHSFAEMRWPTGVKCPTCGSADLHDIPAREIWRCKGDHPKLEFSAKTGSIFEDSPIGFDKWLPALWLLSSAKNGISSCELARALFVTQKTAWFMLHRVRTAMETWTFEKLAGRVESGETYIGANQHCGLRPGNHHGRKSSGPGYGKIVQGIVQCKGDVRAFVVPDTKRSTLTGNIRKNVAPGATVYTNALRPTPRWTSKRTTLSITRLNTSATTIKQMTLKRFGAFSNGP